MPSSIKEMLPEANAAAPRLDPAEALAPFAYGSSLTVNRPIWIRGQDKAKAAPRFRRRRL